MGGEGEGSGVKGGGKWGERVREVGIGYPPLQPLILKSGPSSCLANAMIRFSYLATECFNRVINLLN